MINSSVRSHGGLRDRPDQPISTPRTVLMPISVADAMVEVLTGRELYAFSRGEPPSVDELRARAMN